ncbi:MAG: endolytic transglycosylase MltG [Chitinophagales bacterium]|nr:endolytic transglycosylase MltG [Chitinophagales bacterium]
MKKKFLYSLLILFVIAFLGFLFTYKLLFADNINNNPEGKQYILYIHTGATYQDVLDSLKQQHIIKDFTTFKLVSRRVHYESSVKPGRYIIPNNMGNLMLIRKLRSGAQDAVKITFNNIKNKEQLATQISGQLEATKKDLLAEFNNPKLLDSLQLTEDNFPTIFLANTYEFYWNTSARQFIERMLKEYNKFWNSKRLTKAQAIGLTPTEVTILASIVQKESNQFEDYPIIAGVYLNRMKIGMPLQADPTVLFALNKLGISRRVTSGDLRINSPYNTYLNKGLPPGPICLPELKSIDKTLDADEHNYLYFCAREDFSGYSNFAATWEQHIINARRYQKALNDRNIH